MTGLRLPLLHTLLLLFLGTSFVSSTAVSRKLPDNSDLQRIQLHHSSHQSTNPIRSSPFLFDQRNRNNDEVKYNELYNVWANEQISGLLNSGNSFRDEAQRKNHSNEPGSYEKTSIVSSKGPHRKRSHRRANNNRRNHRQTRPRPPPHHYQHHHHHHHHRRPRYHSLIHHNQNRDHRNRHHTRKPQVYGGNRINNDRNINNYHLNANNSTQPTRRSFNFYYPPSPRYPPVAVHAHPHPNRLSHGRAYNDPNYHPIPPLQLPHLLHTAPTRLHPTVQQPAANHYSQVSNHVGDTFPPREQLQGRGHLHHGNITGSRVNFHNNNRRESPADHLAQNHHEIVRTDESPDDNEEESTLRGSNDLRVGKSLNIFSRYGFLTLSIKVRPPVGLDNFLFLENTAEVFQRNSYWGKREIRRHNGNYDDHFYIHFCENLNELLLAYFDHFAIEGVLKAHKAFTSSLSVRDLARQFGINSAFLGGHFSFVLVRLFRRKKRSTLKGPLKMEASLKQALKAIRIGSTESVHQFVDRYGSHVITEFEVGDMMYQTFVFGERLYKELQNKFAVVRSENHLEELQPYFTPSFATNVGNVLLASGNAQLSNIIQRFATPEMLLYPNIFKLFDNRATEEELEKLGGEVVLSLKLDKITSRLPPSPETRWMSEVLDNTLAVYYEHLGSTRKNS